MDINFRDGVIDYEANRFQSESGDTVIVNVRDGDETFSVKVKERHGEPLLRGREYRYFGKPGKYYNRKSRQWVGQFQAFTYCGIEWADKVVELMRFLQGRRFPRDLAVTLVEEWGDQALARVRMNPYTLLQFPRCGWKLCDAMYLDLGGEPAKLKRQTLCAAYDLVTTGDGSTWHHERRVEHVIGSSLRGADPQVYQAVRLGSRSGWLAVLRTDGEDGPLNPFGDTTWIAAKRDCVRELELAEMLVDHQGIGKWPEAEDRGNLSDHQWDALQAATSDSVGVLIGGGGTGKTHTVAFAIRNLIKQVGHREIALCAPTGKAAVRMSEALAEHGIPLRASTVHSLLRYTPTGFVHDASLPLPYRFVICDEASMVDLDLMHALVSAIPLGSCLLLVGDPHQLPPVGPGAPFRDMIEFVPAKGELTEVRRNCGQIVKAGEQIRKGRRFGTSKSLDWESGDNLVFIETRDAAEAKAEMLRAVARAMDEFGSIWDCQVLAPVNRKSELGTQALNSLLQGKLNPGDLQFRVGDKVMNTQNTWASPSRKHPDAVHPDATVNIAGEVYVANGDQGRVLEVHDKFMVVEMACPRRVIMAPTWSVDPDESDGDETGSKFVLAYAITVHKSQGGQWPVVVGMIDDYQGARRMFDRSLIYTLISRATKYCVLIGSREVADAAVRRASIWNRKTFLRQRYEAEHARHTSKVPV